MYKVSDSKIQGTESFPHVLKIKRKKVNKKHNLSGLTKYKG